ncbi:NUDIX domain-containing protein [Candidatus Colwellia aromaticivorans]|uniref:NUDIX domain-containing protein n=1 Tax=Candidatus Colwellia aromaticivorans TaxID=2267621 RepID=UPI000DF2F001|nr:NUDIX domain-containing protein [Candidatus Colwellia aromaticivorans]
MQDNKKKQASILQYDKTDVTISAIETKYHGFFKMNEYHLNHKLFSGDQSEPFTREVFERGDAVVVMLYDPKKDTLLLLEQFRPGILRANETPWMLEFVAGMFDDNESPIDVAIREAKEEANIELKPASVQLIMKYFSSPGGTSECIHLYWAPFDSSKVSSGSIHGLAHENEDIMLHVVSRNDAFTLLTDGKISNAATVIGLQWLAINYQNL